MNNYNYFDAFNETFLGNTPNYGMNGATTMPNLNMDVKFNMNTMQANMLFGPYEGYTKGNLFRNLYQPYKNYQPATLTPKSEQEQSLLNLNQMQFAMHELNLYLDVYPNDTNMMNQFVNFRNSYNQLLNEYESKYGAIEVNSPNLSTSPFGWVEQLWPWDRKGL